MNLGPAAVAQIFGTQTRKKNLTEEKKQGIQLGLDMKRPSSTTRNTNCMSSRRNWKPFLYLSMASSFSFLTESMLQNQETRNRGGEGLSSEELGEA